MRLIRNINLIKDFSVGMELEISNIERGDLPDGAVWSTKEYDVINSNPPIAIDSSGNQHKWGGEVNTKWSWTIEEQLKQVQNILFMYPTSAITHRSHLHCHVAWEGIKTDIDAWKRIMLYEKDTYSEVLEKTFPLTKTSDMDVSAWHYCHEDKTLIRDYVREHAMVAKTPDEFFHAYGLNKDGTKFSGLWIKRFGLNIGPSIKKHGTIEFRHFWQTLDVDIIQSTLEWCVLYINEALGQQRPLSQWCDWSSFKFPPEIPFRKDLHDAWVKTNFKK